MSPAVDGGWPELDEVPDNTIAFLANRLTGAVRGTTWPNREAAIVALLDAYEAMSETDSRSDLLYRFFRVEVTTP
jgi:hypothetical protein